MSRLGWVCPMGNCPPEKLSGHVHGFVVVPEKSSKKKQFTPFLKPHCYQSQCKVYATIEIKCNITLPVHTHNKGWSGGSGVKRRGGIIQNKTLNEMFKILLAEIKFINVQSSLTLPSNRLHDVGRLSLSHSPFFHHLFTNVLRVFNF